MDILDAGCGTGLVGSFVVDRARRMDGVDLSPAMLEKARKKRIYDNLYEGDLVAFFRSRPSDYDVITAAGTLNHFADLLSVFNAATVALRDGGLFIFTVFSNEHQGEVTVHPTAAGCFAHGHNCVVRTAEAAGFTIEFNQVRGPGISLRKAEDGTCCSSTLRHMKSYVAHSQSEIAPELTGHGFPPLATSSRPGLSLLRSFQVGRNNLFRCLFFCCPLMPQGGGRPEACMRGREGTVTCHLDRGRLSYADGGREDL